MLAVGPLGIAVGGRVPLAAAISDVGYEANMYQLRTNSFPITFCIAKKRGCVSRSCNILLRNGPCVLVSRALFSSGNAFRH